MYVFQTMIQLSSERFRAPEILFHPHLIGSEYPGVQNVLANSVFKADLDMRRILFGSIVLAGGSTMFPLVDLCIFIISF